MANENDIGGRVGLDITDFKANIAELNRQIKVIESGFKAAAAGMDDWSKSEEGLQQRIESLNQITDLQRQKVANLKSQYEKIVAEKGANSKAAQDLLIRINKETEALNRNLAELQRSSKALEDFQKETDQTAEKVDELESSLEEANAGMRELASGAASAAAAGIAAIGTAAASAIGGLLSFSGDASKALNKFQAQTGASAEEMEEFREIATDLYNSNLGESIEDVAASMATVRQVTKQTGEELRNTTKNAILLRDTFGYEVNETINAANSLMKQFGITADEAYTLIAQAAQNGADKNGDLLDTLNEYAPQFKALGFSANEFTNILIDGAENGAFSIDKVGDAVKEFNIRSKDLSQTSLDAYKALGLNGKQMSAQFAAGGDAAQKAFATVLQKMNEIEDPLKRNTIGVGLFGTQFEDLEVEAILALRQIGTAADMSADTLQQINNVQYSDLHSAFESIRRGIVTQLVEPIEQNLLPTVNAFANELKDVDVTPIVTGLGWILDNAGNLAAGAAAVGAGMLTWNVANTVLGAVQAIKNWRVATQGMTVAQAALNLVMSANPIGLVITAVAALAAGIAVLWHTNEDFRNAMIRVWKDVQSAIGDVYNWVKHNWDTLLLMLVNPFAGALKLLYDTNPRFREWADNLGKTVKAELERLPGDMKTIGTAIVKGLWNGISGMGKWVKNKVADFAGSIVSGTKDALGIRSPSKVMADEVGRWIPEGIAKGIAGNAKSVDKAMKSLFENSKRFIEDRKFFNEMSLAEELAAWERVQSRYKKGTDERREADREVYRIRQELFREGFESSKEWIDREKTYRGMSLAEELAAWERVQTRYAVGTAERAEAEQNLLRIRKQIYTELKAASDDYFAKVKEVNEKLAEEESRLTEEYNRAVQDRARAIAASFGLFDAVEQKDAANGDELLKNLRNQVSYLENWSADLRKLSSRGIDRGLLAELEQMGPNAAGEIAALVRMSEAELSEYEKLWREKNSIARSQALVELQGLRNETQREIAQLRSEAASQLEMYASEFTEKVKGIRTGTKSEFDALNEEMPQMGADLITGLMSGLDRMSGALTEKARKLAQSVADTMKSVLDIHSPSRVMRDEVGKMIGAGLAEGIVDSTRRVQTALRLSAQQMHAGAAGVAGSTSGGTYTTNQTTVSFADMFRGAQFSVRNDEDLRRLERGIGQQITISLRGAGLVP